MNLAINNYCNSKCPYCFAGKMGIDSATNITLDNFRKILSLMEENHDNDLCLFGGEPTIHPQFEQIINLINEYKKEKFLDLSLLTNGIKLGKFASILPADTALLININDDEFCLSSKLQEEFNKSLDTVTKLFDFKMYNSKNSFGCNLYIEKRDYSFFWRYVDKYKVANIRVSVTTPKNNEWINNRDAYFVAMKPVFMEFIEEAKKRELNVSLDCSQIPWCYFDYNDRVLLREVSQDRTRKIGYCTSDFIVLPDLTMTSCFGSKDFEKCKMKFETVDEICNNYKKIIKITNKTREKNYMEKCFDCIYKEAKECNAGCLGFKN